LKTVVLLIFLAETMICSFLNVITLDQFNVPLLNKNSNISQKTKNQQHILNIISVSYTSLHYKCDLPGSECALRVQCAASLCVCGWKITIRVKGCCRCREASRQTTRHITTIIITVTYDSV